MDDLEKLNEDPKFREYMTVEEDRRKCYNSDLKIARRKGIEEGIEQGIKQGSKEKTLETVKKLLELGILTDEQIAEVTELSVEEVIGLKENIN